MGTIVEGLADKKIVTALTIPAAGNTTVFDLTDVENVVSLRLFVQNTGANALDAAALSGSSDGTNFFAIDSAGITSAFGTLASSAGATIFETNLLYRYLRFTVSAAAGGTTVTSAIILIYI